jgi:hypothetical protein
MGTLGTMAQPSLEKGWRLDDFREWHVVICTRCLSPVNLGFKLAGKFAGEINLVKIV